MNEESRDKEEIYEFFSKNGKFFALAGCVFVIFAFFLPMIQVEWYIELGDFWDYHRFWIFGLDENNGLYHVEEWFGTDEEAKLGVALISIGSTIVISLSVLGTIFISSYSFVRKRKKGVYSSRVALFCSIGVFGAVQAYMWLMPLYLYVLEPPEFLQMTFQMGPFLFIVGSLLILLGYTANIIPLLKLFSLYLASSLMLYGVIELLYFFSYLIAWEAIPPIPLDSVIQLVIPASIALFSALSIILINCILYRSTKKRKNPNIGK